jgi:hypothetical protein
MSKTRFPEIVSSGFSDGQSFDFFKPHEDVGLECLDASMTRQEFAEDCDINSIMARYETTGVMHAPFAKEAHYADYTNVPDLMTAMQVMRDAEQAFMLLPAAVRRQFDNDPVEFVEYASKPENLGQMRLWGMAAPAPAEPPQAAPPSFEPPVEAPVAPPPGGAPKPA